jgi:AcrR family transcriptional regulator
VQRARSDDDKDTRRQLLLDAALDEFFERGFSAARMEDIARRADLSKGTLYLYFKSKDDLFREIIAHLATPNLELVKGMISAAPGFAEAMDRLASFVPMMIRQSRMPKLMKVMIGDSHNFPNIILDYRRTVLEELIGLFGGLFERANAAGEVEVADPKLAARIVMGPVALSGLWQAVFGRTPDAEIDLESLFRMHADAMKKAFAPTGQTS